MLHDSTYMRAPEYSNPQRQKVEGGCQGLGWKRRGRCFKGTEVNESRAEKTVRIQLYHISATGDFKIEMPTHLPSQGGQED